MYSYAPKYNLWVLEVFLLVISKLRTTKIVLDDSLNKYILVCSSKRILYSNENEK